MGDSVGGSDASPPLRRKDGNVESGHSKEYHNPIYGSFGSDADEVHGFDNPTYGAYGDINEQESISQKMKNNLSATVGKILSSIRSGAINIQKSMSTPNKTISTKSKSQILKNWQNKLRVLLGKLKSFKNPVRKELNKLSHLHSEIERMEKVHGMSIGRVPDQIDTYSEVDEEYDNKHPNNSTSKTNESTKSEVEDEPIYSTINDEDLSPDEEFDHINRGPSIERADQSNIYGIASGKSLNSISSSKTSESTTTEAEDELTEEEFDHTNHGSSIKRADESSIYGIASGKRMISRSLPEIDNEIASYNQHIDDDPIYDVADGFAPPPPEEKKEDLNKENQTHL